MTRRFQTLEQRIVLTAAPTVVSIEVASTSWDESYVDFLDDENLGSHGGIEVSDGDILSHGNIDQVMATFSEDVLVQESDLTLTGVNEQQFEFSNFSYDAATYTATWTLTEEIALDKVYFDLGGDGLDPIEASYGGLALDGDDNGTGGDDFEMELGLLPGDVDLSGVVSATDFFRALRKSGLDTEDAGYDAMYDVDGSGEINSTDTGIILAHLSQSLPAGDPAGLSNDAPTSSGLASVFVNQEASNEVIDLWAAFDDTEDTDSDLTFSVESNSNSALFTSVTVDNGNGELTLDFDPAEYGTADLVIRATDSNGLFTDVTLHVDVNGKPSIIDFEGLEGPNNVWTFTGQVIDPDDSAEGLDVVFGGVLAGAGSVTTDANGYFTLIIVLAPSTSGEALAQTEDEHEAESGWVSYLV